MRALLLPVGFCLAGFLCGRMPRSAVHISYDGAAWIVLCLLMFLIGVMLTSGRSHVGLSFRMTGVWVMLPVAVCAGTWAGAAVASLFFQGTGFLQTAAVASGFGYYSLSGILIRELRGADLGALALMSNLIREILTIIFCPFIVKYFGGLSAVASGGATAMDTTLPFIVRHGGPGMAVPSAFTGFILTVAAPVLIAMLIGYN